MEAGTANLLHEQYIRIYDRVGLILETFEGGLKPVDIYMLKRVRAGALKEAGDEESKWR